MLPSFPAGSLGVVIGASGAIGGALLDSLQHAFGVTRAIGFSRKGLPSLDLTSEASIASAACQLLQSDAPPRLIIDAMACHRRKACASSMQRTWPRPSR